ncbi:YceI family protein [Kribbella qitaiheensis]|uniref:YceI family protein n=1 Tax=Kribbella qitaiheensis TaxID=1544730 RepID=A0A7G6X6J1_9ACTN|nr:YceI family protein [Kribbella qitaiheensis]QNE21856.1 YceI family protein [Kribbella qitaiheensis]
MTITTKLGELTGDYVLDTANTRIGFVIRQVLVMKVRGRYDEFEGSAHLDGDDPSKSSVRLTIQAKSIQTRNKRRDEHLGSAYLDAANHPTITFTSTRVEQVDQTNFKVTGDLTVRGATKPVTVAFELTAAGDDPSGGFRVGFEGKSTINRNDWGVSWNAVAEGGGALVGEQVTLDFSIVAIRRS